MRQRGSITGWQDERGFGFIEPASGGQRVFAHIRSFPRGGRRPGNGDTVTYELVPGTKGRVQAGRIAFVGTATRQRRRRRPGQRTLLIALGCLAAALMAAAWVAGALPATVPAIYVGMSVVTFLAYAWDKWAALSGRWRTPEDTLLTLCLFGGWPGGLIASTALRHKSRKRSYRLKFWLVVTINVAVLGWAQQQGFDLSLLSSG